MGSKARCRPPNQACLLAKWLKIQILRRTEMRAVLNAMPTSSGPSLGGKWIKANVLAAIVFTLTGLVGVATEIMLIIGRSPTVTTLWIAGAIGFSAMVVSLTVYAALTGAILSEKLPAFSRRAWIAMHGAVGAAFGAIVVASYLKRAPLSTESLVASAGQVDVPFAALLVLLIGPALGALFGGLQALVLRRAARGVLAWIAWSAAAGGAVTVFAAAISFFNPIRWPSALAYHVVSEGAIFVALLLIALVMLPAFNRLTRKN
jgi:hypothetical protein